MKEKPQEKTPVERNNVGVEYNLINDLGFNLCVAPWSLVVKWSHISELREVVRKRSLESKIGMEWTGIGLGPVDVNLQTEELYCNYTVRATGHKTPGESSVDITDCNYDTTHLQENPQRLEWGSWRDLLYYILVLHLLVSGSAESELN